MKIYNFNICKYHVTIKIERKKYKPAKQELAEQCAYSFTGWNYDEALKPHTIDAKDVEFGETVVYHGPFPGYKSEEIKMEETPTTHETFWPNYIPFSEYCEAYIDGHVGIYSKATLKGYKNIVENHLDNLMACDVQDVTETCIQDAFDREIDKGLSVKTLKGYKSFVLKVIDEYYDNGFIPNIRVTKEGVNE